MLSTVVWVPNPTPCHLCCRLILASFHLFLALPNDSFCDLEPGPLWSHPWFQVLAQALVNPDVSLEGQSWIQLYFLPSPKPSSLPGGI